MYFYKDIKNMTRAFGVGCFHFGYRRKAPFEFTVSDFMTELEKALGSVQSIGEISATYSESFDYSVNVEDEWKSLGDGHLFPHILFLRVDFSVFIPARIQDIIIPGESISNLTTTERFRVSIRHGFYGPVSYIECINPREECDPSSAVRLLREYMSKEFSKLDSSVTFEFLGPSPFHADFYVQGDEAEDSEIRMEELKQRGYNRINFFHDSSSKPDEVLEFVLDELTHELDLYYDIVRRRVEMMGKGEQLVEEWSKLQMTVEQMPAFWKVPAKIKLHRAARNLVLKVLTLKAEFAVNEREIARAVDDNYRKGTVIYMEKYVRNEAEELLNYPLDSILAWAQHIEQGSFKQTEIIAVVLSAIGGGIVASIATTLLSSGK